MFLLTDELTDSAHISDCNLKTDDGVSISNHISKTEVLINPAQPDLARNLMGIMIDDQLNFNEHVASVTSSSHITLYNIRKIWCSYMTECAAQLFRQWSFLTLITVMPFWQGSQHAQ